LVEVLTSPSFVDYFPYLQGGRGDSSEMDKPSDVELMEDDMGDGGDASQGDTPGPGQRPGNFGILPPPPGEGVCGGTCVTQKGACASSLFLLIVIVLFIIFLFCSYFFGFCCVSPSRWLVVSQPFLDIFVHPDPPPPGQGGGRAPPIFTTWSQVCLEGSIRPFRGRSARGAVGLEGRRCPLLRKHRGGCVGLPHVTRAVLAQLYWLSLVIVCVII